MWRRLASLILALLSGTAAAHSELRLDNLGRWKFSSLQSTSTFLPDVEAKLVLPSDSGEYTPTIYIQKLPVAAEPRTLDEWNHLIFLKRMPGPIISRPEVLHRVHNQYRYVVEYQSNQKSLSPLNTALMAVALGSDVYVFSFSNHRLTFHDNMPAIRELFKQMQIRVVPTVFRNQ